MGGSKIIFLVDDDADDIDFFREALFEFPNFIQCITSSNGEKALKELREWKAPFPDFIFLDLNLPRIDGKKCLVEIKKMRAYTNTPVIIFSTSSEQKIMNEVMALGADHFIIKPNKVSDLFEALKNIIAGELVEK